MSRVIRTAQAENDLLSVWEYIAENNRKSAHAVVSTINDRCAMLALHPHLGPAKPDLGKELRYLPVGSYLVLYRANAEGVEIVRILHGARDLAAIFHTDE